MYLINNNKLDSTHNFYNKQRVVNYNKTKNYFYDNNYIYKNF